MDEIESFFYLWIEITCKREKIIIMKISFGLSGEVFSAQKKVIYLVVSGLTLNIISPIYVQI